MAVRHRSAAFAERMDKPVRIASAIFLVLVIAGAMLGEKDSIGGYIKDVGLISVLFCAISLTVGYIVPKVLGMTHPEALVSGFEIGLHNSTLAITVALTVLDSAQMAVPPAVYGIAMFFLAAAFGAIMSRRGDRTVSSG